MGEAGLVRCLFRVCSGLNGVPHNSYVEETSTGSVPLGAARLMFTAVMTDVTSCV